MTDHDESSNRMTEGGHNDSKTDPVVSPPNVNPPAPRNQSLTTLLLAAAGVASLAAFLTFLLGCLGESGAIAVEFAVLLAVLAMVLDSLGAQTLGGQVNSRTDPVVSPPSLAYVTVANIAAALALLALVVECVIEREHGVGTLAGLLLLLLSAISSFIGAYQVKNGTEAGPPAGTAEE